LLLWDDSTYIVSKLKDWLANYWTEGTVRVTFSFHVERKQISVQRFSSLLIIFYKFWKIIKKPNSKEYNVCFVLSRTVVCVCLLVEITAPHMNHLFLVAFRGFGVWVGVLNSVVTGRWLFAAADHYWLFLYQFRNMFIEKPDP